MNMDINELERLSDYWDSKKKNQMEQAALYQKMVDFVQAHDTGVLGTGHGDTVRCTPVDYAFHDNAFYILSEGGQKFNHLFYNKNVSFAVFHKKEGESSFKKQHSLQVIGTAELVEPFSEEYNHALEVRHFPLKGIQQLPYTMYLIKIVPKQMILLDSELKTQELDTRQVWTGKE